MKYIYNSERIKENGITHQIKQEHEERAPWIWAFGIDKENERHRKQSIETCNSISNDKKTACQKEKKRSSSISRIEERNRSVSNVIFMAYILSYLNEGDWENLAVM